MLVLNNIYPQINLIEVIDTNLCYNAVHAAYGMIKPITEQIVKLMLAHPNLIVNNATMAAYGDLFTGVSFYIGSGINKINSELEKLKNEFILVDDALLVNGELCFYAYYLKDTQLNNIALPVLRNKMIDELLKTL